MIRTYINLESKWESYVRGTYNAQDDELRINEHASSVSKVIHQPPATEKSPSKTDIPYANETITTLPTSRTLADSSWKLHSLERTSLDKHIVAQRNISTINDARTIDESLAGEDVGKEINRRIDASAPPETATVTLPIQIEHIDDDETSAELAAHIENVVAETGEKRNV